MTHAKTYTVTMTAVFAVFVIVFAFLPRSVYSEVEKRDLAEFPEFSLDELLSGNFTDGVSSWFSDTEPFREELMLFHMKVKKSMALKSPFGSSGETLAFHASEYDGRQGADDANGADAQPADSTAMPEENAKLASKGVLVVGEAPNARALMIYGGNEKTGDPYANVINKYHSTFPDVNIYCMVIPNSSEFYMPAKAKDMSNPQIATIRHIHSLLEPGVKVVDVWTPLNEHKSEYIFLRTDHHWAPRGAYYAAKAFAKVAGVPFKDLNTYTQHVVHGYVGSMYGYSHDLAVKNSPEDFYYWTPNGVDYTTTYITYTLDKERRVVGRSGPHSGKFFQEFSDGSGAAYCTFMGGDSKVTQVRTSTKNHRRLIILKDSYGNAIPGYLFHSFEEIHVIDCRYFKENLTEYVRDNKITDILFANNVFMCGGGLPVNNYYKYLNQRTGALDAPMPSDNKKDKKDKDKKDKDPGKDNANESSTATEGGTDTEKSAGKSQERKSTDKPVDKPVEAPAQPATPAPAPTPTSAPAPTPASTPEG